MTPDIQLIDSRINKLTEIRKIQISKNEQNQSAQSWARIDELKNLKKSLSQLGEQKGTTT